MHMCGRSCLFTKNFFAELTEKLIEMGDIIDSEELDKDTVDPEALDKQFSTRYHLRAEKAVSLKKSYINRINGSKSLKLAVSLSDSSIEVYQVDGPSLSLVCRLSGHAKPVADVVFSPKDEHLLYSAGQDGAVKLWDLREKGTCAQEYKNEEDNVTMPFECMDVSCNGRVLCAGSQLVKDDAYLVFWDQRQVKPLGGYWSSHTEDITQVRFHKEKRETLVTGSTDGLLNVFNITEPTEDDALLYSLNVENSVERLGWLDETTVACLTQSNDLQIWDTDTGDMLKSFGRDKVAKGIKRSKGDDCYLVDCFATKDNAHTILAGSHGGNGDCLRSVTIVGDKKLQPCTNFAENKQVVSCSWYEQETELLVTTGESGIISVWSGQQADSHKEAGAPTKLSSTMKKLHVNRPKPY